MADWVEDLEKDLKDVLKKETKTQNNLNNGRIMDVTKLSNNNNPLLLFGLVLILVVGVFLAWKTKTEKNVLQPNWQAQQQPWNNLQQQGGSSSPWNNSGPQQVNPWQNPTTNQPLEQKFELLKKQYENIDTAAQKIWERTKWNSDRITLLATVNNHNLAVQQQNLPKIELIFLNSDWTINRLPNRIALDSNDQEFLKKFLK